MLTQTHTFVEMELSAKAYDEIRGKMIAAGYQHVILAPERGVKDATECIDMHGIAVTREK